MPLVWAILIGLAAIVMLVLVAGVVLKLAVIAIGLALAAIVYFGAEKLIGKGR